MLKGAGGGGGGGITPGTTVITGGTNTRVLFDDNGVVGESAGLTYAKGTGTLTATAIVGGNITSSALTAGRVTFAGASGLLADSASLTFSSTLVNSAPGLKVGTTGTSAGLTMGYWGTTEFGSIWANNLTPDATNFALATALNTTYINSKTTLYIAIGGVAKAFIDSTAGQGLIITAPNPNILFQGTSSIASAGANQLIYGGTTLVAGAATSRAEINKSVTGIADNVATATFTVTVPNGNHSAGGKVLFKGAAGAGGAIGADEFSAEIEYDWVVTRTTGANAVATLSAALLTAITASVAGGATPTIAVALSAISGAVGATNTFTFNVTIHAITGSSTNHTCFCYNTLLNDNTSGVTIA